MKRSEVLQEVRLMRFEDVCNLYRRDLLCCREAAEALGSSVSAFLGMRRRREGEGVEVLREPRLGECRCAERRWIGSCPW
jgi:hypothetical protein